MVSQLVLLFEYIPSELANSRKQSCFMCSMDRLNRYIWISLRQNFTYSTARHSVQRGLFLTSPNVSETDTPPSPNISTKYYCLS